MNWIYVESSALLERVTEQPRAREVAAAVATATKLVTSELAILEAMRVLARAGRPNQAPLARLAVWQDRLHLFPIGLGLKQELARPFPLEPVRTLDAIHLATALCLRVPGERVGFLALDERIRQNAAALGFAVLLGSTVSGRPSCQGPMRGSAFSSATFSAWGSRAS